MPLLYAAATASHQMQVYIVGSLQFSKCLCGGGLVIIHVVCYSVTWSFYENICQFVGRKLRHYLSGCVCLFCGYLQYYIQRSTKKTDLHVLTLPQPDMLMESPSADLLPDSR